MEPPLIRPKHQKDAEVSMRVLLGALAVILGIACVLLARGGGQ